MRVKEIDTIHGVDCYAHAGEKLCYVYKDESTLYIENESYDFGRETTQHSLAITDEYLKWETDEGAVLIYSITQGKVVTTFNDPERPVYLFSHNKLYDGCILINEGGNDDWYKYNLATESKEAITVPDLYYRYCYCHETQQHVVLGRERLQKQGQNGADDEYVEDTICFDSDFKPRWTLSLRGRTSNGVKEVTLRLDAVLGIYDGKLWLKLSSNDIVALD
ncbi:hypothetical protein, partial [Motilimonas pumila]